MADAVEAFGQHMDEEAADELAMAMASAIWAACRLRPGRHFIFAVAARALAPSTTLCLLQQLRHCPVSKVHCAPPPAFCLISLGSIVHFSLEKLSIEEPAAPSEAAPATVAVALSSLA